MSRTRTAADALLPTGRAWTQLRETSLGRLLDAAVGVLEEFEARAALFLDELAPSTATELLPRWEHVVGSHGASTIDLRRVAVVQRLAPAEDMSLTSLVSAAAELGYAITPTEFDVFRAGAGVAGDPVRGEAWLHTLDIAVEHGADDLALRHVVEDGTQAHVLTLYSWTDPTP